MSEIGKLSEMFDQIIEDFKDDQSSQANSPKSDESSGCLFIIDQINHLNMRRKGVACVPIKKIINENYIPIPKRVGIKQM
jgi:hypothetical protein